MTFSMTVVPDDVRERASRTAAEHLNWLGHVMEQRGDLTGALLAALLVRHLLPGEDQDRALGFSPMCLYSQLGPTARAAFPGIAGGGTVVDPSMTYSPTCTADRRHRQSDQAAQ